MMTIKKLICVIILVGLSPIFFAQKTQLHLDKDRLFKTALDLFDKKQYTAAQKSFLDFYMQISEFMLTSIFFYFLLLFLL